MYQTREEIEYYLEHFVVVRVHPSAKKYQINDDLTVDTFGETYIQDYYMRKNLKEERKIYYDELPIQFNIINGDFAFQNNYRSLRGCPRVVKGNMVIYGNFMIKDVTFFPEHIEGNVDIKACSKLTSLSGIKNCVIDKSLRISSCALLQNMIEFPTVGKDIHIVNCDLKSIQPLPDEINGSLILQNNKNLYYLDKQLSKIPGKFYAIECGLKNLENFPKYVRGVINISQNPLINLKGLPEIINSTLKAEHTTIETLSGGPSICKGGFHISYSCLTSLDDMPLVNGKISCFYSSPGKMFYQDSAGHWKKGVKTDCSTTNIIAFSENEIMLAQKRAKIKYLYSK
jgi:hypothetical protein